MRELKNFVERMLIMHAGNRIGPDDLPPEMRVAALETADDDPAGLDLTATTTDLKIARAQFEARFLEARLKECGGNVTKLAEMVGMERSSLYRKLKAYNISVQE